MLKSGTVSAYTTEGVRTNNYNSNEVERSAKVPPKRMDCLVSSAPYTKDEEGHYGMHIPHQHGIDWDNDAVAHELALEKLNIRQSEIFQRIRH